jgi:hypothetical protein
MKTNFEKERLQMIDFFVRHDMQLHGYITEDTREAARVQKVEIIEDGRRHKEFPPDHPLNICEPKGGQYKECLKIYGVKPIKN